MSDGAEPIAYTGVAMGVAVLSSTGNQFGTLDRVLQIPSEDLFDGIIVAVGKDRRFVDRDQIAEITTEYIKCDLDDDQVAALPGSSGNPVFDANVSYGEGHSFREWVHRTFGHGGWRTEK
jgi:hypothetical protein